MKAHSKCTVLLLALTLFSFSCSKKSISDSTKNDEDMIQQEELMPLSQDMELVYETKSYENGVLADEQIHSSVVTKIDEGTFYMDGQKYWQFEDGKIYRLFPTRGGAITRALYFFEPEESEQWYSSLVGGDVVVQAKAEKVNDEVTVSMGTFPSCLVYTIYDEKYTVVPGTGIVRIVRGKKGDAYYSITDLIEVK